MAEGKKEKKFLLKDVLADVPDVSKSDTEDRETIEYIDIGLIDEDPNNFYSLDGVEDLAANIELVGLQQPLRIRPNPEKDGRYLPVSGHRRRAALKLLAKQNPDKWGKVACIEERGALNESAAMTELRLIYANSSTREMTDADKAKQVERVTALLYQLKEEGVEFPGRMRDHVAEACQINKTKLARLKVIQDKLVAPKFVEMWKAGELKEDPAHALAQMPALMQEAIAKRKGPLPSAEVLRAIQARGMDHYLTTPLTCKSGEGCTNGENFLRHDLMVRGSWAVGRCKCCVECAYVNTCRDSCPAGQAKAAKARSEAAAANAKAREAAARYRDRQEEVISSVCCSLAKRVAAAAGDRDTLAATVKACEAETAMDWGFEGDVLEALGFGDPVDSNDGYEYDPGEANLPATLLVALCRQLSVSADYLLGLADDPLTQMVEGGTPTWRPGDKPPEKGGTYYAKFDFAEATVAMTVIWNAMDKRWEDEAEQEIPGKCLGWYPIPTDEEDDDGED